MIVSTAKKLFVEPSRPTGGMPCEQRGSFIFLPWRAGWRPLGRGGLSDAFAWRHRGPRGTTTGLASRIRELRRKSALLFDVHRELSSLQGEERFYDAGRRPVLRKRSRKDLSRDRLMDTANFCRGQMTPRMLLFVALCGLNRWLRWSRHALLRASNGRATVSP